MAFDALTLSAVRDELEPLLTDTRIQKLVFPDELSLAIEVFGPGVGRTHVLLSADQDAGRVQRIDQLPARGLERDTPFTLLLRKYLRSAHIRALRQPRMERLFELDCEQRDASGLHVGVRLIVEAMGRRSNLVLVGQDGLIMDAARRSPPSRNPRRPVLPHLPYELPPPQDRLLPEQLSAEALATAAAGRTGSLARLLSERIAGLSPLAGRELAFRATGDLDRPVDPSIDWAHVAHVAREFVLLVETHEWRPSVALDEDGRALEYAPYALTHLVAQGARLRELSSISEAIAAYYAGLAEGGPARRGDALLAERRALLAPLERTTATLARRITALEHQLASGHEQRDPLRRAGEAIMARQADLPLGSTELSLDGERFELDPLLTGVQNAQAYFARYRKAREAEERVPELLELARNEAAHLADLRTLVEVAEDMAAIRALGREVAAATGRRRPLGEQPAQASRRGGRAGQTAASSAPFARQSIGDGWEVLRGTSAAGNAAVTFDLAQPDDLWLHARGLPGAHVILRTRGGQPPDTVVERAAQLAAWHSAGRAAGAVEVDVAPRRHVRKIPNGPPGLVRYANERTIRVTPRTWSGER